MITLQLWQLVVIAPLAQADVLSEALFGAALAVDIEMGDNAASITALFPERLENADVTALIGNAEYRWMPLEQQDWLAAGQRHAGAGRIGAFTLTDTPTTATQLITQKQLYVESFHAFGDGYHATTQGCLRALEYVARHAAVRNIADIGCGTAVLAFAAHKLFPAARMIASDIDDEAVVMSRRNRNHNAALSLPVVRGPGIGLHPLIQRQPFDLVIANILVGPLTRLVADIKKSLKSRGFVVLSGLMESQIPLILKSYGHQRLHLRWRYVQDGWATLVLQ